MRFIHGQQVEIIQPSKLYRNGMIEGSPFNIDSIDFIGIFGSGEEDE